MVNVAVRLVLLALVAGVLAAAPAGALDVVVTIKPLHSLVARVMAGTGTPHLLVQGAASAHTYALRPSDAARLNASDVFIRMSDTMEPFTARLVRALPSRVKIVTLEEAPKLSLLPRRTGATFADAGHGSAHKHGHKQDAAHGESHGHAHGKSALDGHTWLDPVNARAMVDWIAEALSAKDPAQAATYRQNAAQLKSDLEALDAELARELAPVAGKPFVVFHDALQYFERRYGLTAVGAIAVSPEVPPGARRISALRRQVTDLKAACILAEPQFDTRLVDAVTEGTRARIGSIDPEGSRIEPGVGHYAALLRRLAQDLKACLTPPG